MSIDVTHRLYGGADVEDERSEIHACVGLFQRGRPADMGRGGVGDVIQMLVGWGTGDYHGVGALSLWAGGWRGANSGGTT